MAEDNTQNTGNQQGIPAGGQPQTGGPQTPPTPPEQGASPTGGMPTPSIHPDSSGTKDSQVPPIQQGGTKIPQVPPIQQGGTKDSQVPTPPPAPPMQPSMGGAPMPPTPPAQGGAPMPQVPSMGGMPAPGAPGMGMSGDSGGAPIPPPPPKDEKPANFKLGSLFAEGIKITLPEHPDTQFDESKFLFLLASSISLSRAEKKRIIDAVPKLKQWQVDELVTIFDEEHKKFAQLSERHVPQLEKLAKQHFEEWKDIEMEQQQMGRKQEDQAKADEIKKQLGL